ncbi:AAA family ATPase [Streptomyces sp. NPDC004296]|uniref:AAA family ATPase n=1 Tax=Streptomyces sp. NPDC004296 TaxID=3364697 RepID=UPI00367CD4A6
MTWAPFYVGNGIPRDVELGDPPPWRTFPRKPLHREFQPPADLIRAVNAALALRRPLLITGPPGSGKSTVIEQVATELQLGDVLRWHITSHSTITEALYRYDALGRIHAQRLEGSSGSDDIQPFLQMGPLGTALLPTERPRALLIDEIDKSDLDLPSDLLDVLERGEFEIPELTRYREDTVHIRGWGRTEPQPVIKGHVQCIAFPFIVLTSNGERDFSSAFLRRCIRYTMPLPTVESLRNIVAAHLHIGETQGPSVDTLIEQFVARIAVGESLALDQLLNAVSVLTADGAPEGGDADAVMELILRELSRV